MCYQLQLQMSKWNAFEAQKGHKLFTGYRLLVEAAVLCHRPAEKKQWKNCLNDLYSQGCMHCCNEAWLQKQLAKI